MTRGAGTLPPLGLYPDVAPLAANGTPCGALNPYPLSQFPDPQNVSYIFSEVCQLPEFVTLYETWGIGGFGLGYGGWLNNSSDTSVSFGFNFAAELTNVALGNPYWCAAAWVSRLDSLATTTFPARSSKNSPLPSSAVPRLRQAPPPQCSTLGCFS